MNLEKATSYINALYEKRGFSKEGYIRATELREFGIVVDDDGTVVDDDVSRMLYIMAKSAHARRVLEIGISIGYSTISMAHSIRGDNGKIFTIEQDKRAAQQATRNFERVGVAQILK